MYCIDCKLFITNNLVALHFVQVRWVTNSLSLNFLKYIFNLSKGTDHKNGTPREARMPRLVLIHSNNSDLLRLLMQILAPPIFCVFVESKTVIFSYYHYVIAVSQWNTEIQTLFGR